MPQTKIDGKDYDEFLVRTKEGERLPVDVGSAEVNLNGDVVAEFDGVEEALGTPGDAPASSDSATSGLIGLIKRLLGKLPSPRTPTTTSVASSATSVTILAANPARRGVTVMNDSTATLRLSFSSPATAANAFVVVPGNAFLVLDQQLIVTGAIYGIWSSANGAAQVTEYV